MRLPMDSEIASLTLRALRRVLRATEIGSRQLATTTGLTPSQLLVLREIDARLSVTPSAVAQALQFSQATITAIVDRLVALGFVQYFGHTGVHGAGQCIFLVRAVHAQGQ